VPAEIRTEAVTAVKKAGRRLHASDGLFLMAVLLVGRTGYPEKPGGLMDSL
jgi:hypothetical protein